MRKLLYAALLAPLLSVTALAAGEAAPGYYTPQKVVYHNDGAPPDNGAYFKRLLGNIRNHVEALGRDKVEIRVVDHAPDHAPFRRPIRAHRLARQRHAHRAGLAHEPR